MRSTPRPGAPFRRLRPVLLLAALACGPATGDATLEFRVARVDGDGWRADGVAVSLQHDDSGRLAARVSATRLDLPPPLGPREAVHGECRDVVITPRRFSCNDLVIETSGTTPTGLRLEGRIDYRRDTGALEWALAIPAERSGRLQSRGQLGAEGWSTEVKAIAWPIEGLAAFAEILGLAMPPLTGRLDLSLVARGDAAGLQGLVFELAGAELAGGNEAGTTAVEALGVELRGSAWPEGESLAFDVRGTVATGEVYVEPVYADLQANPLRLVARGRASERSVTLGQLVLEQQDTAHVDATAELERTADAGWRVSRASVRFPRLELPGAYTMLLQPFLAGTVFGNLETSGQLRGELTVSDARLEGIRFGFARVNLDDREARLAIYGLSGDLAWTPPRDDGAGSTLHPLELDWSGGFVYGIPFGAAGVRMAPQSGRWVMAEAVSIPVLDGALEIDALEVGDFASGDDTLLLDARLTPVDMRDLSLALNWPPLSGQLSGRLPRLSHADGVLAIGGELTAEVFSGTVAIRELRVERPLQPRARLRAEVELRGLELMELTEALSFGLMTGRLDGYVRGLEMIDWAPVAFDARLYTPPDDRSRRRISQRAVDNIANLGGGGGAGALSTGFLRFFEDFAYDAFALGCRLERDVCEMSGLEPRDTGYVILRGRGLPRIDIMGYSQRVSWSVLLEQLASIMESEGPEIR
ncbi:MAG: hypothetical protein ACNA8G_03190 [Gammaproteobacteria bacterium]